MPETIDEFVKGINEEGWLLCGLAQINLAESVDHEPNMAWLASIRPHGDWSFGHGRGQTAIEALEAALVSAQKTNGLKATKRPGTKTKTGPKTKGKAGTKKKRERVKVNK